MDSVFYRHLLRVVDTHLGTLQCPVMSEMQIYRRLGLAVAARRKELDLTQAQVAAQLGLTRASLASIETGRQRLLVHQLFRLVDALKLRSILELVPETWLFDDPEPAPSLGNLLLSEHEATGVHRLLRSALAPERARRKTS